MHIKQVYKLLHTVGNKLPKREKLGIHQSIEKISLELLELSIEAVLLPRLEKHTLLYRIRRKVETLKHLVRIEQELHIISEKQYAVLADLLTDISMMATGWQKSTAQNTTQNPPK